MNIQDLEIVTYDDAARMLGVAKSSLGNAVSKGVLTAFPRQRRKPGRLALEQVELFKGKTLSLVHLSPDEAVKWLEIKQAITARKVPDVHRVFTPEQMKDEVTFAGVLLEGLADMVIEVIDGIAESVQADNFTMDTMIDSIKKTPSFRRLMSLVGVNLDTISDETASAINEMAYQVADRVQVKLIAVLLKHVAHDAADKMIQQFIPAPSTEQDSTESQPARAS